MWVLLSNNNYTGWKELTGCGMESTVDNLADFSKLKAKLPRQI